MGNFKINLYIFTVFLLFITISRSLFAAVGCDLNDPDRDVRRLFPGSTGYKTNYVSIDSRGGKTLLQQIETRLGDKFTGLYETIDVPYTIYEIYKGKEVIGYIHGVNQKGLYGGIQIFLSLDKNGIIKNFYFQRLTASYAAPFRHKKFGNQFKRLSLKDFYNYNVQNHSAANSRIQQIKNPVPKADNDFRAILRGVKKNLILMDEFIYSNQHLPFYKK